MLPPFANCCGNVVFRIPKTVGVKFNFMSDYIA
uniref:Uncharacterized protein n=1 Tax=Arundo donax TaxID=35708 RepID=A0A0A9BR49_ARUDO